MGCKETHLIINWRYIAGRGGGEDMWLREIAHADVREGVDLLEFQSISISDKGNT